jgi:hypothetical protein
LTTCLAKISLLLCQKMQSTSQVQTKMADMEDESSRQSANPSDDQYTSNVNLNDESDYMGDNVSINF